MPRTSTHAVLVFAVGLLFSAAGAFAQSPPVAPAPAASGRAKLPAEIIASIRRQFGDDARYLAAAIDLDGDGRDEQVVHVFGAMSCGTGGCVTQVFARDRPGFRLVSSIGLSRPPIRVSKVRAHGWRNLIFAVGGGGMRAHVVELAFDGHAYPENPTVPGPRVRTIRGQAGDLIIADVGSFDDATPLPPASR